MAKNFIAQHRSIIVLNGTLPHPLLFQKIALSVPIIAADGAAQKLMRHGMVPTYVIGDGDSYQRPENTSGPALIINLDQDSTDFEKCIAFVRNAELLPALVLGVSGGEIDHTLGNMQALVKHAVHSEFFFLDSYEKDHTTVGFKLGIPLRSGECAIEIKKGTIISIIPFDNPVIVTRGLKWNLDGQTIGIDGILAVRNEAVDDSVLCKVSQGRAIVIVDVTDSF